MSDEAEASDVPHANVVFIGPCGCGKSTTVGHLIADSGAIDRQTLSRIAGEAAERGQEDRRYAWILDKLRCERDRGGTMYVALWRIASRRCRFTIIDAPGHNDFAKDTVTAMSQADIAVLVVSAADGADADACEWQIRERALLAYTLGLRQLVVCVNKMDSEAVAYSEDHFRRACARVREDFNYVGLKTHDVHCDVHFVPTSGWTGDNVVCRSANTPWYCGLTLIEALDDAVASYFRPERPLRLLLHEYMQIGGTGVVVVGRVATGSLRPGMQLILVPGNVPTEVRSIEMHHQTLEEAASGDNVNVTVDVAMKDLRHGMVASAADDSPACECSSFLAQVIILSPPRAGEISAGCVLWVECHTARVSCVFEELLSRTDRRTGQVLEMKPETLHAGDAAVVRLRPEAPMCVEPFSEYPPLGRFAVRDQKTTVAVGVVQQVDRAALPARGTAAKSTALRCKPAKVKSTLRSKDHGRLGDRDSDHVRKPAPAVDDSCEEGSPEIKGPGASPGDQRPAPFAKSPFDYFGGARKPLLAPSRGPPPPPRLFWASSIEGEGCTGEGADIFSDG
mmetsp:Transcript_110126/g.322193  ORF Transcript_110126/g.322193 Transcript_110126/m.322193 type:complete len:565 (+) Transcript_110126:180-1874(+)